MSWLFTSGGQNTGALDSASVLPMNIQLISFRIDGFDLFRVQRVIKSLLHCHSSKASILRCSAFFTVQLSHPYMTTGKNTALTRRTFVDKVISLLFNMLFRLVITFLPRSKRLLISRLQSPSAVILEPRKIKSNTVSMDSPSVCHGVVGHCLYEPLITASCGSWSQATLEIDSSAPFDKQVCYLPWLPRDDPESWRLSGRISHLIWGEDTGQL